MSKRNVCMPDLMEKLIDLKEIEEEYRISAMDDENYDEMSVYYQGRREIIEKVLTYIETGEWVWD